MNNYSQLMNNYSQPVNNCSQPMNKEFYALYELFSMT